MKTLCAKTENEFADFLYRVASENNNVIVAVMFYKEAFLLLKELINKSNITIGCIELCPYDYDKEYYITLDSDSTLWIEPAYIDCENEYKRHECVIAFYNGDVSSKIISRIEADIAFEVSYDNEDIEYNDKDKATKELKITEDTNGLEEIQNDKFIFKSCESCCEDCSNCTNIRKVIDDFDYFSGFFDTVDYLISHC